MRRVESVGDVLTDVLTKDLRNLQATLEETDPEARRRDRDEMRETARNPERAKEFLMRTSLIDSVREAAAIE